VEQISLTFNLQLQHIKKVREIVKERNIQLHIIINVLNNCVMTLISRSGRICLTNCCH